MEFASSLNARASLAGLDVIAALEFVPQSVPATASSPGFWILASVIQVLMEEIVSSNQWTKNPATKRAKTEFVTTTRSALSNLDSVDVIAIRKHA